MLVHMSEKQRLQVHNWNAADGMPESWVEANGDGIANLHMPLFPHSFAVLNERVLASGTVLSGGGHVDSIFRPSSTLWTVEKPKQQKKAPAEARPMIISMSEAKSRMRFAIWEHRGSE